MAALTFRHVFTLTLLFTITGQALCQSLTVTNGSPSNGNECCGLHLIDSASERVIIETSRTLTPGTYKAIRLRLCTTDTVLIQLWNMNNAMTATLRWQMTFSPSAVQTSLSYVIIPVSLTILATDVLGFYSLGYQLPLPFSYRDSSVMRQSSNTFPIPTAQLKVGQTIDLGSYVWTRTFRDYIFFCKLSDCSDLGEPRLPSVGTSYSDYVSFTQDRCCENVSVSCYPSNDATDVITETSKQIRDLQELLEALQSQINSIVSKNYVTGLCPEGFLSGSYGVGSCYLMVQQNSKFESALARCREYGANVLALESLAEEQFIVDFVAANSVAGRNSSMTFATSGFLDETLGMWFWLTGTNDIKSGGIGNLPLVYKNWRGQEPREKGKICLTLHIDYGTAYWTSDNCATPKFYICEIDKTCL